MNKQLSDYTMQELTNEINRRIALDTKKVYEMRIGDSFKEAINNSFRYSVFWKHDKLTIKNTLNSKARHSDNISFLPYIDRLEVEPIDDTHDKVTIIYDDISFGGVVTWRPSSNGRNFVFLGIE